MEATRRSLITSTRRNTQRILAERQSAVDHDGTVPDDLQAFTEYDDIEDDASSDSIEGIAEIATECDLLSPAT